MQRHELITIQVRCIRKDDHLILCDARGRRFARLRSDRVGIADDQDILWGVWASRATQKAYSMPVNAARRSDPWERWIDNIRTSFNGRTRLLGRDKRRPTGKRGVWTDWDYCVNKLSKMINEKARKLTIPEQQWMRWCASVTCNQNKRARSEANAN